MFSSRVPADLTPNTLAGAVAVHRATGRTLFDLTATNPTTAGIVYPESILAPLADGAGLEYRPEPLGLRSAREAVSRDYARLGTGVAADRIVLTSSTSEAYSLLFKLLCDPGDEVLIPAPSYPLFEHLSALDAVRASPYRLEYHGRWLIDEDSVDAAWTDRVRAVLAVSPNNPTGSRLSSAELEMVTTRCAEREAALIIDEVFRDYPLSTPDPFSTPDLKVGPTVTPDLKVGPTGMHAGALAFRLGGLSKSAGLPQVKLGWIGVDGPDDLARSALARLEVICDTYLSVSTPVQAAAGTLIERGAVVRSAILARVRDNHAALTDILAHAPSIELLHADAGWAAVLRIPSTRSEEAVVLDLLQRDSVLVHPGYFFDFAHEAFLIVSLLPPVDVFREGVGRLVRNIHG
ncbi:MAG TPA: pyridoxal phosphate-dependent aminotransferase [Vicinamibacterales bacterium]|nr:pyridoxal phosphate-dependent aminotransferase [Vicinamibacterales bacterium]